MCRQSLTLLGCRAPAPAGRSSIHPLPPQSPPCVGPWCPCHVWPPQAVRPQEGRKPPDLAGSSVSPLLPSLLLECRDWGVFTDFVVPQCLARGGCSAFVMLSNNSLPTAEGVFQLPRPFSHVGFSTKPCRLSEKVFCFLGRRLTRPGSPSWQGCSMGVASVSGPVVPVPR